MGDSETEGTEISDDQPKPKRAKASPKPPSGIDCSICCSENVRRHGECPKCGMLVCCACVKQYASTTKRDLDCMGCHHPWPRSFLTGFMQQNWVTKGYKTHREMVVMDREKPQIVAALPILEAKRNVERLDEEITKVYRARSRHQKQLELQLRKYDNDIRRIYSTQLEERRFIEGDVTTRPDPYVPFADLTPEQREAALEAEKKKRAEISYTSRGHCPVSICKGMIGEGWRCVVCSAHVCLKCMKRKNEDEVHVCLREDIESIAQIRKDSKPCPACRVRVFKIAGCSQMFCTACNTAFDWNSGRQIKNMRWVHNPHLTEYRRQHRGDGIGGGAVAQAGDIARHAGQCRDVISTRLLEEALARRNASPTSRNAVHRTLMAANEILDERCNIPNQDKTIRSLRVAVLEGTMDEPTFMIKMQRVDKALSKAHESAQIFNMYATLVLDACMRLIEVSSMTVDEWTNTTRAAYDYAVEARRQMNRHYGSHGTPHFDH